MYQFSVSQGMLSILVILLSYWVSEASPTLGCSIEISRDWASEASPTPGCSIEISRDILEKWFPLQGE